MRIARRSNQGPLHARFRVVGWRTAGERKICVEVRLLAGRLRLRSHLPVSRPPLALFGPKCHLDTRSLSFLQSKVVEVWNLPCNYLHLNDLDGLGHAESRTNR